MAQHHGTVRIGEVGRGEMGRGEMARGEVGRGSVTDRGATDRLPSVAFTPLPSTPPAAPAFFPDPAPPHDLYWQGQIDRQREPMALIDTAGRVIRTTPAFDAALCNRDDASGSASGGAALFLTAAPPAGDAAGGTGQRLRAANATDQPALDAAIARAVRAVAPVAAAARCARRDGGAAMLVTLQPLPWNMRLTRADSPFPHPAATLTLIDPLARPPAATSLWCEAFDLTPSEAAVAALLVAGHSLESAAATRGSRATTLRVHLRHLFAKTGTARQSDLVALLLRMG